MSDCSLREPNTPQPQPPPKKEFITLDPATDIFGYGCKTDDVGIFCSPLSNEYLLAATHFGLRRREVVGLCEGAIEAVFGGEAEKERLRGLVAGFVDAEGEGRGGDEVDVEI